MSSGPHEGGEIFWKFIHYPGIYLHHNTGVCATRDTARGGGLGSRPKKMYGEKLGDGVKYHLMSPTPRR